MNRIPHADRPAVVAEFCACLWVHAQNPDDPTGPAVACIRPGAHRRAVHPNCPLHGVYAQPAPF